MTYSPFDKQIGDQLEVTDLNVLVEAKVSEGYYVEYKSQLPGPIKVAHSLASFANTYGGWYIVGVETDEHNVAKSIAGFTPKSCPDPISVVRETVKHHVDPVPLIFPQVVRLPSGNLVLIVHIPDGQDSPFITKDGRVYRRTADSSEPVAETDRYALDRLVERGQRRLGRFERFSDDPRTFSKAEDGGWLNIFLSPVPFGLIARDDLWSSKSIEDLLKRSREPLRLLNDIDASGSLPFDTGILTPDSIILRQVGSLEQVHLNGLALEFDRHGRARLHVPLRQIPGDDADIARLSSVKCQEQLRRLPMSSRSFLKMFDIGQCWLAAALLTAFYQDWISEAVQLSGFDTAIELKNVWRHVPYFDFDSWGEHVEKFGLPVIQREYVRSPEGEEPARLSQSESLGVVVCGQIGLASGLPPDLFARAFVDVLVAAAGGGDGSNA